MKNQSKFRIQVMIGKAPHTRPVFVCKETNGRYRTWDGGWYTAENGEPEQIKIWKTRRGAENWINKNTVIRDLLQPTIQEVG